MSYCRFENTYDDLRDCFDNWEVSSESEEEYRTLMIKLCKNIITNYGDDEDEDE